ncbi:MAG: hypothetical protein H6581_24350 [Bacteroidia bacterium]|nr:hypothetical protein [Bacteroidia bacterium]
MFKIKFTCFLFLFPLLLQPVFAQNWMNRNLIRQNWNEKVAGDNEDQREGMEIFYYHLTSPLLDLRDYKAEVPELASRIPDSVRIILPEMGGMKDTVYAVTFLQSEDRLGGDLLIMVVGNFNSQAPVFFMDWNMNHNFFRDEKKIFFQKKTRKGVEILEKILVKIHIEEPRSKFYQFWLQNPGFQKPDSVTPRKVRAEKTWNHLAMRFGVGMGNGTFTYSYINNASGYPTHFKVKTTEKIANLELVWKIRRLNVVLNGMYEDNFFWSSDKETRLGEPYIICGVPGQGCVQVENIIVERDREIFPSARLNLGLNLEYDLAVGPKVFLSPFAGVGMDKWIGPAFTPDRAKTDKTYTLKVTPSLTYGLLFKCNLSAFNSLNFGVSGRHGQFMPRDYFESLDISGLKNNFSNFRAMISYQKGLW